MCVCRIGKLWVTFFRALQDVMVTMQASASAMPPVPPIEIGSASEPEEARAEDAQRLDVGLRSVFPCPYGFTVSWVLSKCLVCRFNKYVWRFCVSRVNIAGVCSHSKDEVATPGREAHVNDTLKADDPDTIKAADDPDDDPEQAGPWVGAATKAPQRGSIFDFRRKLSA